MSLNCSVCCKVSRSKCSIAELIFAALLTMVVANQEALAALIHI